MKIIWQFLVLFLGCISTFAQTENSFGPASSASSNLINSLDNPFAVFANPNGAAETQKSLAFFAENRFNHKDFNVFGLAATYKKWQVGWRNAGNQFLTENNLSLGYSLKLDKSLQVGIVANSLLKSSVLQQNTRYNQTFNLGIRWDVGSHLIAMAHGQNFVQSANTRELSAQEIVSLGLAYIVDEDLLFQCEFQSTNSGYSQVHFSLTYSVKQRLKLFYGINTRLWSNHIGAEVIHNSVRIYLAAYYQNPLGYSPSTGFAWISDKSHEYEMVR